MNRVLSVLFAALALLLPSQAALAQAGARVVERVSWVEEWDPATQQWVRVEDRPDTASVAYESVPTVAPPSVTRAGAVTITETVVAEQARFIPRASTLVSAQKDGVAQFGPFRVIDATHAALIASTDASSPQAFAAMLAAYPGLRVIEFADAPGTSHDLANLELGRAIRAAGLATHVPAGGSARSGAVELFLAGTHRTADPGAVFAVHSWRDERGREPADFGPDAPENRLYLDYYAEMGMTAHEARAFYQMTNSVPHAGALWLQGDDMARWIAPDARVPVICQPVIHRFDARVEALLRLAVARSGAALAGVFDWRAAITLAAPRTAVAPRLAYADLGIGLLDSAAAFP